MKLRSNEASENTSASCTVAEDYWREPIGVILQAQMERLSHLRNGTQVWLVVTVKTNPEDEPVQMTENIWVPVGASHS